MPEDALRRTRDYLDPERAQVGVGIDLDLAGAAFLERNNKILDQFFQSIEADGAPAGMSTSAEGALKDLGHEAYLSRVDGTRADLYRHTTSPVPPEEDSYQFASPAIAAAGPTLSGDVHAAPLKNPLEKPTLRLVAVANLGFPAGPYLMKICGAQTVGGPLTLATEEISFDVTGTGKSIEWFLLPDLEGAAEQAVFITEPVGVGGTPDPSTFHEQGRAPSARRSAILDGPYNYSGRALPTRNETKIGRSRKPRFRHDFDLRGGQVHDLQEIDALRLFAVECTPNGGMALPSPHSEKKSFKERKRHAIVLQLEKTHPSTTGVKWFCYLEDGPNPTLYQLIMGRRGNKAAAIGLDKKPLLYGYIAAETGESGGGDVPENLPWVLVPGELPTEDTTGLEDPQGAPDEPRVFGQSRPEPGDYLATYSRKFSGPYGYGILESVAAPPARITVPGDVSGVPTHIPEIVFPSRVNRLPNALFSKVGADGRPLEWEFDLTSSTLDLRVAGVLGMRTNGQLTTGSSPWVRSKPQSVVADRVETVIGKLGVTDKATGIARAQVRFYSDDGGTTELDTATRITLASLGTTEGSSAKAYFKKKIGPAADGGEVDWPADAVMWRLWGFAQNDGTSGARNLRITLDSLVWHPFPGELRRYPQSTAGELLLAEPAPGLPPAHIPSLDPATPVNSSHVVATGPPPESPADVAASEPPYDIADFEGGAFPTGWTITRTVANANTEAQVIAAAAIEGTMGFRARSDHTSSKNGCYAEKDYAAVVNGASLGLRFLFRVTRRPTYSGSWVTFAGEFDEDGNLMGRYRIRADGTIQHQALAPNGTVLSTTTVMTGVANGRVLDLEEILGGGQTNGGTVAGGASDFGEPRRAIATLSGLDFQERTPTKVRIGGFEETDAKTRWTFDFDTVAVTPAGYVVETPTLAAFSDIGEPDRPKRAGTILHSAEAEVAQTITTDPREQMGVGAHFASTGTSASDEVLLEIRTSGGTLLAHAVRRTTGQVDLVKGATVTPVAQGLTGTAAFDLDVIARGAGSRSGTLVCYFTGSDGVRRLRAQVPNLNWEGLYAQRALVLAGSHTVSAVRVTERGLKEYRDTAPGEADLPIFENYTAVVPGDAIYGDTGLIVDEDFVMPGVERTCAAFIRHQDVDTDEPPKPLTVVVYNEAGEELVMGNIYGGAGADAPGVSTREAGWTEEDRFFHYTPPAGYYRRRIENREMWSGAFVYQELLDARGHLDTLEARDAKRNEERAASGTMRRILSGRVQGRGRRSPDFKEERLRLVAEVDVPDGTIATSRFRATDGVPQDPTIASPDEVWTPSGWAGAPEAVPDLAFADVEVTLSGDPLDPTATPTIPSGGVALEYRTEQAFLTREDGSPLPGGAHVWLPHGLRSHRLPNYRNARPGGSSRPTPITGRLGKFSAEVLIYVFTPEAYLELVENQLTDRVTEEPVFWRIEAPDYNEVMRVRLYDVAETQVLESELPESMIGYWWVAFRVAEVEVLESGPLGVV